MPDRKIVRLLYCRLFFTALMVVTLSALLSCSQNFGRLMSSSEVTLKFKQYQVDDTFNYYLFGQQSNPTAIIGLNKDVTLESSLWQKIDFDAISLQTLVDRVSGSTSRNGAFILDPQGNRIGVWFAGAGTATIKMAGEKRIAYISPSVRVKQRSIFSD